MKSEEKDANPLNIQGKLQDLIPNGSGIKLMNELDRGAERHHYSMFDVGCSMPARLWRVRC